jgi:hypothetical protein
MPPTEGSSIVNNKIDERHFDSFDLEKAVDQLKPAAAVSTNEAIAHVDTHVDAHVDGHNDKPLLC